MARLNRSAIATGVAATLLGTAMLSGCAGAGDTTEVSPDGQSQQALAQQIALETVIADTHIDVPYRLENRYSDVGFATDHGDFDYPRAVSGGLNAPFMSIYIPAEYEAKGGGKALADKLIDGVEAMVKNHPEKFIIAKSSADIRQQFAENPNRISLLMGMENGTPIEGDLSNLRHFYERGIRYITLAHSLSNHISDSSYDSNRQWNGLSDFGKQLILEMNDIGMIIDVSHISDDAFFQVMEISNVPVLASHSSARHFTPGFERNMSDEMIKLLAQKRGVIQINFGSTFVSAKSLASWERYKAARDAYLQEAGVEQGSEEEKAFTAAYQKQDPFEFASLDDVLDHIDHVVEIAGIDYVGIGSDYDGVGDSLPTGLKDVASYPNLVAGLLERGYSRADIEKILSGNTLRVMQAVEIYAGKKKPRKIIKGE